MALGALGAESLRLQAAERAHDEGRATVAGLRPRVVESAVSEMEQGVEKIAETLTSMAPRLAPHMKELRAQAESSAPVQLLQEAVLAGDSNKSISLIEQWTARMEESVASMSGFHALEGVMKPDVKLAWSCAFRPMWGFRPEHGGLYTEIRMGLLKYPNGEDTDLQGIPASATPAQWWYNVLFSIVRVGWVWKTPNGDQRRLYLHVVNLKAYYKGGGGFDWNWGNNRRHPAFGRQMNFWSGVLLLCCFEPAFRWRLGGKDVETNVESGIALFAKWVGRPNDPQLEWWSFHALAGPPPYWAPSWKKLKPSVIAAEVGYGGSLRPKVTIDRSIGMEFVGRWVSPVWPRLGPKKDESLKTLIKDEVTAEVKKKIEEEKEKAK